MKFRTLLAGAFLVAGMMCSFAQTPKYVFYCIGDGMGLSPLIAAQTYNRTILKNDKPLTMMTFPVAGWSLTYSASSDITDSAAAGTALSSGYKTKNGMLGMNPDTVSINSITVPLREMGFGIGIATSVAPDDATPGAFFAHVPYRGMTYEIGKQMAQSGYEFFAGAGLRGAEKDGNPTDLLDYYKQNNVQVVYGPEGIKEINSDKVVLLNNEGSDKNNIGYTIDSISGTLTLPMIATTAIDFLEKNSPDKFFLMLEGGNIDHALHANDGGAALKEILNFDEALKIVYNFYLAHPDETLIVVTADHDTGGMSHTKPGRLGNIDYQKVSKEEFNNYCRGLLRARNIYRWEDMKEYLTENLGFFTHIPVDAKAEAKLKKLFDDTFKLRNSNDQKTLYANFNAFSVEVFRLFNDAAGLVFTTTGHSGNPVPVFAVGCGADQFRGFNNNIDLPGRILSIVKGNAR